MDAIEYGDFKLSYRQVGDGPQFMLAMNGFGKSAEELAEKLSKTALAKHYRIFCIDFFFHGSSEYPENRIGQKQVTKCEYAALIRELMRQHGIDRVSLFGYSLGGKLALILWEEMPEKVAALFLAAPDGLKKIWWYHWVAGFPPFRWVYTFYIHRPFWYFWWMRQLRRLKILHPKVVQFANEQMGSEWRRRRIYQVWMIMKNLEPDRERIRKIMDNYATRILIFVGRYDRVIRPENAKRFNRETHIPDDAVIILKAGHQLLKPEILDTMANTITTLP